MSLLTAADYCQNGSIRVLFSHDIQMPREILKCNYVYLEICSYLQLTRP